MKIYIWGTGKYGRKVLQAVRRENCEIVGYIDNDPSKYGMSFEGIEIIPFKNISDDYDALIISVVDYESILYQLRAENCVDFSKVVVFFDDEYCDKPQYSDLIDLQKWKIIILEQKVEKLERITKARLDNIGYEIIDKYNKNLYCYPRIGATEEAVDKIIKERCSLVRYGDGEFEIMAGKEGLIYQKYSSELAERLRAILRSDDNRLLIGIANNYGNLDQYTEDTANGIRVYMKELIREFHMSLLEENKTYYDAYMFKSYFPYKNREDTWKRVKLIKKIWENRDIVIVEGDKTRAGYGNDLFDNVKSIRRILTPTKNAFESYDKILQTVLKVEKDVLILVVLGAAANVLVYDLMKQGYQAIDIGQIDMDYEWYRVGAKNRVPIPDRYVSQLPPAEIQEVKDEVYLAQILNKVF